MNKIGNIDIKKAYLGTKVLSVNNAYIGEIPLIKGSGPIPNNEIWYTSSNGIVTPYRTSSLPTIVSNTYADGKGIIKFATDVTSIGDRAFRYCSSLTSVTIPDSVTSIGDDAFNGCSGLTSITIPNSVTSIGEWAFYGCTSLPVENNLRYADIYLVGAVDGTLSSYTIKNGTKWIGSGAFSWCAGLTSMTIPNSVISIGEKAFEHCSGLTSITIPNSVTSIGNMVFLFCSGLTSIDVAVDNPNYCSEYGVLFNKDKTTLIQCPDGKQGAYIIPNGVTSIGLYAFDMCSGLTSITIPNSVTIIEGAAFYGCTGLTSVTIGNSVTSIGENAFLNCTSLTSITIPNSVTLIDGWAFYGCTGLTSVNYTGTMAQWNVITKGNNWHNNVPATVVHCTDGDVAI